jgi:hypothetical protein
MSVFWVQISTLRLGALSSPIGFAAAVCGRLFLPGIVHPESRIHSRTLYAK